MNKIVVPVTKPRNPLVAAAKFRRAGAHPTKRDRLDRAMKREARTFKE